MNNRGRGGRGSHVPQLHTHRLGPRIPAGQNGGGTCGRGRGAPNAAAAAAGRICTATYSRQACAYDIYVRKQRGRYRKGNYSKSEDDTFMFPEHPNQTCIAPDSSICLGFWANLMQINRDEWKKYQNGGNTTTPQEECLYIVGSSGIIKLVLI